MESKKVWVIKNIIYKIFHPRVWITVNRYSSYEYEKAIRESVKNRTLVKIRLLGGETLYKTIDTVTGQVTWTANYPYAFGHAYVDTYRSEDRYPGVSERYSKTLLEYLKDAPTISFEEFIKIKDETNKRAT